MHQSVYAQAGARYLSKGSKMVTKSKTHTVAKGTVAKATQVKAPVAPSTMPTLETLPAAPVAPAPQTIALRGGLAITNVKLTGAVYRVGAPHNAIWWQYLAKELAAGPQPVAGLLFSQANPNGAPAAFIGYVVRRGYLAAV